MNSPTHSTEHVSPFPSSTSENADMKPHVDYHRVRMRGYMDALLGRTDEAEARMLRRKFTGGLDD